MKRNFINKLLASSALVLAGGLVSCNDYLTLYPTDSITKEEFWGSKNDIESVRNAAYYQLTQNTSKILIWGEFRSDNVELNKNDKTEYRYLQDGVLLPTQGMFDWSSMYKGINLCNEVLDNGARMVRDKVDPSMTEGDFAPIKSEMIALRALYYFYLVRAYRDVPFVEHSVDTDHDARTSKIPATPAADLMGILIKQVEENLGRASTNYGDTRNNKCRILQNGMYALLADMYLWRAGLVKNAKVKGFPLKGENGAELTVAQENALSQELLQKSVQYAQYVIDKATEDYQQYLLTSNIKPTDYRANVRYPLYRNSDSKFAISDEAYNMVFGTQFSAESVLELDFDGVNLKNTTISNEFYGDGGGSYSAGTMVAASGLFNVTDKVDVEKGYGKTDLRMVSYGLLEENSKSATTPIIKGAVSLVSNINPLNTREGSISYNKRNNSSQNAHWPVYRLTDVMTIQAEALARLTSEPFSQSVVTIQSKKGNKSLTQRIAYQLAEDIYRRNNPGADTLISGGDNYSQRLRKAGYEEEELKKVSEDKKEERSKALWAERYAGYSSAVDYVAAERQREFLGEGKRWFDIVRQCEFTYDSKNKTKGGLEWAGLSTAVRARLQSIWSLYNPIYVEELKVNGKNYGGSTGGQLVQNPAWEKYMPKTNNGK